MYPILLSYGAPSSGGGPVTTVAPTRLSTTNSGNNFNNVDLLVSIPAVSAGDLILLILGVRQGSGGTAPAGYTLLGSIAPGGLSPRLLVFYRIAPAAAAAATANFVGASSSFRATVIQFAAGTYTGVPVLSAGASGTGGDPNPDALSVPLGMYQWIAASLVLDNRTPSAYPYAGNNVNNLGNGGAVSLATCSTNLSAASQDPGVFTIASVTNWAAATIAVNGT